MRRSWSARNNLNGWPFDIYVTHGAGAYICGEETALLESLEGKKGMPRLKPPFSGQCRALRLSDHRQQCRVDCGGAGYPAARCGLVRRHRPPNNVGTKLFCISAMSSAPVTSKNHGDSVPRTDRTHCGGIRGGWDN